jgi:hypothetical protein
VRNGIWVLLLAVGACSGDPLGSVETGLVIYPSSPLARPGDDVSIRLINWSGGDLEGNLCPIAVQRNQGQTWSLVYSEPGPGAACPAYLRGLIHGHVFERPLSLPATLPPGEYRVVFESIRVEDGPTLPEDLRASQPFMVVLELPE